MKTEANIEIVRFNGTLKSISVVMPVWEKIGMDELLSINVPLLGIKTFAKDADDADIAIKESLQAFCINCEKFGVGLESELSQIGWTLNKISGDTTFMSFSVSNSDTVIEEIMQTGEQFAEKFEIAC